MAVAFPVSPAPTHAHATLMNFRPSMPFSTISSQAPPQVLWTADRLYMLVATAQRSVPLPCGRGEKGELGWNAICD